MSPRYWVTVHGPNTTGPFGSDEYAVDDSDDVKLDASGAVAILTTSHGAKPQRVVTYPVGQVTKVVVGLIQTNDDTIRPDEPASVLDRQGDWWVGEGGRFRPVSQPHGVSWGLDRISAVFGIDAAPGGTR